MRTSLGSACRSSRNPDVLIMESHVLPIWSFSSKWILGRVISCSCNRWCHRQSYTCHPEFIHPIIRKRIYFWSILLREVPSNLWIYSWEIVRRVAWIMYQLLHYSYLLHTWSRNHRLVLCWPISVGAHSVPFALGNTRGLNLLPTRYCLNFVRACKMASISLSYME